MKIIVNYEEDNMRVSVDVYTLDLHTNHYFQKLSDEDIKYLKESLQHSIRLTVLKLKRKYDLSKMQD